MKATLNRELKPLEFCKIIIPGAGTIRPTILPDISDQKSAAYNDEPIMGRSFPMKTYSHSENRSISMTLHFLSTSKKQADLNLQYKRWIESAVYPREAEGYAPYVPPPVCTLECGQQIAKGPVCAVLRSYSTKYLTDVPWDEITYMPWKFDMDTSWDIVYKVVDLPGAKRIVNNGR